MSSGSQEGGNPSKIGLAVHASVNSDAAFNMSQRKYFIPSGHDREGGGPVCFLYRGHPASIALCGGAFCFVDGTIRKKLTYREDGILTAEI